MRVAMRQRSGVKAMVLVLGRRSALEMIGGAKCSPRP